MNNHGDMENTKFIRFASRKCGTSYEIVHKV
jgi:hypothetical protein